jgi:copper oxidase (laccase) domain-containing protein
MIITPNWPVPSNIRAAISCRDGGVSQGVYNSWNMGTHVSDDPAAVEVNRKKLIEQLALQKSPQWLEQIHGNKIVESQADGRGENSRCLLYTRKRVGLCGDDGGLFAGANMR